MKIAVAAIAALIALPILIGGMGEAIVNALFGGGNTQPSQEAVVDIPPDYLALYQQAATVCPGLDWAVLAAIGKIESNHGRSPLLGVADGTANYAGAEGPMQFLQPTFNSVVARHPIPPGGRTPPSPWNAHDAIYAAAYYLCDSGAQQDIRKAIFAYNHADWYVDKVLAQAALYRGASAGGGPSSPAALVAVAFAQDQLGKPYVWGGDGAAEGGFDCSGLTHAAYQAADVTIPRTAQTQYNAGPLLPPGTPLQPGDLVFFGTPGHIHHVGIALGGGTLMINAPTFNERVRIDDVRAFHDFSGATRPTRSVGT